MSDLEKNEIPTQLALPESDDFKNLGLLCEDIHTKLVNAPTIMEKMACRASAIHMVCKALNGSLLKSIKYLQGSPLGFRTDRDLNQDGSKGKGYPDEIIRDVAVNAMILGLRMDGNEVNIIGGNLYCTQQGFERLVNEAIEGHLEEIPGIPKVQGDACFVTYGAKWIYNGEAMELEPRQYALKANRYTTFDAYLGKARRRMLRDVYRMITGHSVGLSEDLDGNGMKNVTPTRKQAASASGSSYKFPEEAES